MPTGRAELVAVEANGVLYALGGVSSNFLGTVEAYDPLSDKWMTLCPMPTARSALAAAVVNGVLFAVGGSTAGPTYHAENEAIRLPPTYVTYTNINSTWTAGGSPYLVTS